MEHVSNSQRPEKPRRFSAVASTNASVLAAIICLLSLFVASADEFRIQPGSQDWRELFDPPVAKPTEVPVNSGLRRTLFDQLRPQIEREAKRAIQFRGTLRTFKNWALFEGSSVDSKGNSVKLPPMDNDDTVALWLRTRDGWRLIDFSGGHSDVFYIVWSEKYGVPGDLLRFSEKERVRPESQEWRELFDPPFTKPTEIPVGSDLRKTLFDQLRPQVEREVKRPVRFEGSIRVFKNWALLEGGTVDTKGNGLPEDGGDTAALWLRTSEGWRLIDYNLGHTDVFYIVWSEKYGAPKELVRAP